MSTKAKLIVLLKKNRYLYTVIRAVLHITHHRAIKHTKDYYNLLGAIHGYNGKGFVGVAESIKRAPDTKLAVVLHLYYPQTWESLFRKKLRQLQSQQFDLFVTLPIQHSAFRKTIQRDFPDAYIFEVPNRGRDVLPFLQVALLLQAEGYEYLLKIHSKKSTHRTDGSDWFGDLINKLIPEEPAILGKVIKALESKMTAIVGPETHYLSLSVNFEANQGHMHEILSKMYSIAISRKILDNRSSYGFFAGTMFWVRLDALAPVLAQQFQIATFEAESGQIDATFAHALERVFCLSAEIEHKDLYEVNEKTVTKLKSYKTDNIPDWSDVYIGPKA